MRMASVADVKARLSTYLKETQEGPVIVTRNGKAVAVLVAVTDEDELERLVLVYSPKFQALLDKSRAQIHETGGIPHAEFCARSKRKAEKTPALANNGNAEPSADAGGTARSGVRFPRHPASDRPRLVALPASVP